jgi:hypothetical protein
MTSLSARFRRSLIALAALVVAGLASSPLAATTRYVSGTGTSTTGCSATSPCPSLDFAHNTANTGDTILCLSPPTSFAVLITKTITIDCSGNRAPVRDSYTNGSNGAADGIVINIPVNPSGDPLRTVRLRGLSIDGANNPAFYTSGRFLDRGIEIQSAAAVYIEDCVIENVAQQGIYDRRTGGQTKLFVKDTVISGNGGPGVVASSGAPGVIVLDNVSLLNNLYGLATAAGNNVTVKNSTISGNLQAGVEADGGAQVNVKGSVISNNNIGVLVGGTVRLSDTDVQFNNQAVSGSAISLGGNKFSGNAAIGNTPSLASGAQADVYN